MFAHAFDNCTTLDEAKSTYRRLALENHPDRGGTTENMQALNAAYSQFLATFAREEAFARQRTAHAEGKVSAADFNDMFGVAEVLARMILFALNYSPDIEVELCGLWVWLSGTTKEQWPDLKAAGFKWSPNKARCYFAGVESHNHTKRRWTMDEIRGYHGSFKFQREAGRQEDDTRQPAPAASLHA